MGVQSPVLQAYQKRFLEEYGLREVPVVELLDETIGLGPLDWEATSYPLSHEEKHWKQQREALLLRLGATALQEGKEEIVLDEAFLQQLSVPGWETSLPPSIDVYISLLANNANALNAGLYQLAIGPRTGVQGAGRSFSRFRQLDAPFTGTFAPILQAPSDSLIAEIKCLPLRNQGMNVVFGNRPGGGHKIAQNIPPSQENIPLEDILVGVHQGQFYLWSRTQQKRLLVVANHLLNGKLLPPLARFLIEVSRDNTLRLSPFFWGESRMLPRLPRVRIGQAILALAQWTIRLEEWEPDDAHASFWEKLATFAHRVQQWRQTWQVPEDVYLVEPETDQRLALNLANVFCISILKDALQQNHVVTLQEMRPGRSDAWVKGEDGSSYLHELVIPLQRTPGASPETEEFNASLAQKEHSHPYTPASHRCLPGGEWLYVKLYCHPHQQNFLLDSLHFLLQELHGQDLVKQWFFLRYSDPKPHLRVRFLGEPGPLHSSFLPQLSRWAQVQLQGGNLRNLTLDTYDQELERYGGEQGLRVAEACFAISSDLTLDLLDLLAEQHFTLLDLGLYSADQLLQPFLAMTERQRLYVLPFRNSEEKTAFTHRWHSYQRTARQLLGNETWLFAQPSGEHLYTTLQRYKPALAHIANRLHLLEQAGEMKVDRERYLSSVLHMHFNRLGVLPDEEKHIRRGLARTLESFLHQELKT
jgi:thiopeptide-type bacteriocin biosynthesis protein